MCNDLTGKFVAAACDSLAFVAGFGRCRLLPKWWGLSPGQLGGVHLQPAPAGLGSSFVSTRTPERNGIGTGCLRPARDRENFVHFGKRGSAVREGHRAAGSFM